MTVESLAGALADVCRACGLDPAGATLIRHVNNAVFQLARDPVVVRLVTLPSYVPRAEVAVRAATWFAEHGVPAIRLVTGVDQPVRAGRGIATVWDTVPAVGPAPDGADLAAILRTLHALPVPPATFPEWDPLADLRNRLADTPELSGADRSFLERRCEELAAAAAKLDFMLPPSVLHGDAHVGNVIPGPDGPVVCDFDSCCVGPPEWDLTPMAVSAVRFGRPAGHQRDLAAGYGTDVTAWEGFEVLRGIRDLKIVAGVFPGRGRGPAVATEFERRMASLRAGRTGDRWQLLR
ncbi:MAG: aminoglycoside phosphotransferase family protein [Actinomycetota bacterium]|nr:aminoglycoside phosphotransferase family protein [Actinomycetota bacterium]